MKGRVFVTRALPAEPMERLRAAPEVVHLEVNPHDRPVTRAELLEGAQEAQVLLSQLVDPVDAEVLGACPDLVLVANYAVGYDNVDVEAARARGVSVSNTPGVLTEATAEHTWALILAVTRRVVEGDELVRSGRWRGWAPRLLLGMELGGKTLGIVGLGRIGAAVARRAAAFRMRVVYSGPREKPEVAAQVGATYVSLEELLSEADVVSLHPYLDDETRHLIDAVALRRMKPSAYLVNMSRGPVLDEAALVLALERGELAGAALDVYEGEPKVDARLGTLDRVVLAPHAGSATVEARTAMGNIAVDNVLDVLAGREPRNAVT